MKRSVFYAFLSASLLGLGIVFFIDWGQWDVVIQKIAYLIGPGISLFFGFQAFQSVGGKGKRSTVILHVISALALWFVAECVLLIMIYFKQESYPSFSDVLFILGYVAFSRAIYLEAKLFDFRVRHLRTSMKMVLGIIALVIVSVVGVMAIRGYRAEESFLANITTLSWSMGDLIMGLMTITLLAMSWEYRRGVIRREWLWFIAATGINFIADILYNLNPGAIADGSWMTTMLDLMWEGGYLLMTAYFFEFTANIRRVQEKLR